MDEDDTETAETISGTDNTDYTATAKTLEQTVAASHSSSDIGYIHDFALYILHDSAQLPKSADWTPPAGVEAVGWADSKGITIDSVTGSSTDILDHAGAVEQTLFSDGYFTLEITALEARPSVLEAFWGSGLQSNGDVYPDGSNDNVYHLVFAGVNLTTGIPTVIVVHNATVIGRGSISINGSSTLTFNIKFRSHKDDDGKQLEMFGLTTTSGAIAPKNGGSVTIGDGGGAGNADTYKLPVASADVLGGIKIGDGLTIDENGVVNVTGDGASEYKLPVASADVLGGIKIGDGLTATTDGTVSMATATYSTFGGVKVLKNAGLQLVSSGSDWNHTGQLLMIQQPALWANGLIKTSTPTATTAEGSWTRTDSITGTATYQTDNKQSRTSRWYWTFSKHQSSGATYKIQYWADDLTPMWHWWRMRLRNTATDYAGGDTSLSLYEVMYGTSMATFGVGVFTPDDGSEPVSIPIRAVIESSTYESHFHMYLPTKPGAIDIYLQTVAVAYGNPSAVTEI